MARLRDVPKVLRQVGPIRFGKKVWAEVHDDTLWTWASALAYSWLFAIFPFFIFLLTLIPYLPARLIREAKTTIDNALDYLPWEARDVLWNNVLTVLEHKHRGLLSLGIIFTLMAASGGVSATMSALDRCYDVPKGRSFLKQRLVAVFLMLVVVTLILAVLVLLPVGSMVTAWVQRYNWVYVSEGTLLAWNAARYSLALVLMLGVLAAVYHFGPSVKQRLNLLTPGAVFVLAIWLMLAFAFRVYIDRYGKYDQTYGTVGGVAILLLFFYLDAFVLLLGAEINSEIDFAMGVPRGSTNFRDREQAEGGGQ